MSNYRLNAELRSAALRPWAIAESYAGSVAAMLGEAMVGRASPDSVERVVAGSGKALAASPVRVTGSGQNAIAIVQIYGLLLYNLDMLPYASSARRIATDVSRLAADNSISQILLDISSPGGVTSGIEEAATAIFAARKVKRVTAIANPMAASAAYWLGSQATEFAAIPSGDVGSVGVFVLHVDQSQALEQAGIRTTFIKAGRLKTVGNSLEPLDDEAKQIFQRNVDAAYERFVADVARGRGVSAAKVRSGFGEGRLVMAREAKSFGMVDRIATPEEVFASIAGGQGAASFVRSQNSMTEAERQAAARARRIAILSA